MQQKIPVSSKQHLAPSEIGHDSLKCVKFFDRGETSVNLSEVLSLGLTLTSKKFASKL